MHSTSPASKKRHYTHGDTNSCSALIEINTDTSTHSHLPTSHIHHPLTIHTPLTTHTHPHTTHPSLHNTPSHYTHFTLHTHTPSHYTHLTLHMYTYHHCPLLWSLSCCAPEPHGRSERIGGGRSSPVPPRWCHPSPPPSDTQWHLSYHEVGRLTDVGWCFTNLCYYGYSQVVVSHKIRSLQLTIHTMWKYSPSFTAQEGSGR